MPMTSTTRVEDGEEDFETSQTVCAAFLVYSGHEVKSTVWENGTCTFFFDQSEELAEDFGTFIRNKALVEPVAFSNAFGQCSTLVRKSRDGSPKQRRS